MSVRRPFAAALGFALLASGLARTASTAAQPHATVALQSDAIQRKQAEIDATHRRLEGKRGALRSATGRVAEIKRQLAETNAGIALVGGQLDALDGTIRYNERGLAWNRTQLDAAESTLARHNDALRRRVVDAYERGDLGYLNVLLSASSFSDFVERWQDIAYLIAANQRTVRDRQTAERSVARARGVLESKRIALAAQQHSAQLTKYRLDSLATQRKQLEDAADAARASAANQVAQLEGLSASEESSLEDLIRERQREEAARRAAEAAADEQRRRAAQLAGVATPQTSGGLGSEGVGGDTGAFSWPASGPITSGFGMRANVFGHGGFEMHPGIDIGAPMGSTITAAAGGRVIFAGTYGGYGNAIIIDHGQQTSTLYGHCSQIFVANGQDVQRGQAIGAIGMTGLATGPHLHFEVRVNGVPVDPTTRLR